VIHPGGIRAVVRPVLMLTIAGACTWGEGSLPPPSPSHRPATVTLWTFAQGRELEGFQRVLRAVATRLPWIHVVVSGGKSSTDIQAAINDRSPPDVVMEAVPDTSAAYCSTGAWIDLDPLAAADNIDLTSVIVPAGLAYSRYRGVQCALPMLTDAMGLYYNTAMFRAAGIASPPRTYSELVANAKKLTTTNPDGSLGVVGFDPLNSFYDNWPLDYGVYSNAPWYDPSGRSALARDPRWAALLRWQKSFVDWYGYERLSHWYRQIGGVASSLTPADAFETGKVAMVLDGEWRVAFMAADHATVHYATAPFPVADDLTAEYGKGQVGGSIIGIPSGVSHVADAWAVVKYLALDTRAQKRLGELWRNIPTTFAALKDPVLHSDPHFAPFLRIFANPHSAYRQTTPLGGTDASLLFQFITEYLAGDASNLRAGLRKVATKIDSSLNRA
jgi:multiple sugar transport system substrate-binding protein